MITLRALFLLMSCVAVGLLLSRLKDHCLSLLYCRRCFSDYLDGGGVAATAVSGEGSYCRGSWEVVPVSFASGLDAASAKSSAVSVIG